MSIGRSQVRQPLDLRSPWCGDLLLHQSQWDDEVWRQAQRLSVQGTIGRSCLRGSLRELLRLLHRDRVRADANPGAHAYANPDAGSDSFTYARGDTAAPGLLPAAGRPSEDRHGADDDHTGNERMRGRVFRSPT